MKSSYYKRYGGGKPKKIVEPKWVKKLSENDEEWTLEQDMAYLKWSQIYARKGYSREEWSKIIKERQRIKEEEFIEIAGLSDYDGSSILKVLKKKLEWQAEYFEHFGHCVSNPHKAAQMRLCCKLIDIICRYGQTKEYTRSFRKYVNTGNAARFESVPTFGWSFIHGAKQELRFKKAYSLLFKVLYQNTLSWWD